LKTEWFISEGKKFYPVRKQFIGKQVIMFSSFGSVIGFV